VAQGVGPEFKPQLSIAKKEREREREREQIHLIIFKHEFREFSLYHSSYSKSGICAARNI
jgi:hypothetical protein